MIKKLELDKKSLSYIKDQLYQGGHFSECLLRIDLENGSIFTLIPDQFSSSRDLDYGESLTYISGERVALQIENYVIQFIQNYLDGDKNRYVIFETIQEKGDPIILKRDLQHFFINSKKYDFLRGSDESKPIIEYLHDCIGYPTVIILANLTESIQITHSTLEWNRNDFLMFVEKMDCFVVGAFDGEGYIFWCNDRSDQFSGCL